MLFATAYWPPFSELTFNNASCSQIQGGEYFETQKKYGYVPLLITDNQGLGRDLFIMMSSLIMEIDVVIL